jgi:ribonuclease G
MTEEILINITPREVRVALLHNTILQEIHIERTSHQRLLGNIYKGKINRLLPGIQAAFVDIGLKRAAFLYVNEIENHGASTDIRDLIHPGQELLVQVYKDHLGSKGARLTTQFTIPSRYLVLTPSHHEIAVSQKITDEKERQRLLNMITQKEEGGYIFRTAAVGASEEEIQADKLFLSSLWEKIKREAAEAKIGDVVYQDIPIVFRILRDMMTDNVSRIRVDHQDIFNKMCEFSKCYLPQWVSRIEFYAEKRPIFDIYSVEDELQKTLLRKVYLKSGGYLVFDQTEAMTTIDVNTGSYLGHSNLEQTIFKINLEALDVIARQVRLRNLGGIIIIDFIDMTEPLHRSTILEKLKIALAKDSARIEVSELSSLGLVQMTRKRTRESLEHILCVPCPLCEKRGSIKSVQTVSYDILREIKRTAELFPWSGFLVLAGEEVVQWLSHEEKALLTEVERELAKTIQLRAEFSYTQEQYDILPMTEKE